MKSKGEFRSTTTYMFDFLLIMKKLLIQLLPTITLSYNLTEINVALYSQIVHIYILQDRLAMASQHASLEQ